MLLADGEMFRNSIAAVTLVMDVLMAVGLYWVGAKTKKIDDLETRVHSVTTKLIDERFRSMTHELNGHVHGFAMALDEMKGRLQDGDVQLRGLGSVDQKIEIQMVERIAEMKQWFMQNLASKADLKDHEKTVAAKFEAMSGGIGQLSREVAVLSDRAERP